MSSTAQVDEQQLIDSGRFTRYQFLIAFLCFIIIAIDGFDTAIIGFIAPSPPATSARYKSSSTRRSYGSGRARSRRSPTG